MGNNSNLNQAIKNKDDEFYTTYENVEKEVSLYIEQFRNKKVLCNCDNPSISNFWKFFEDHFNEYKIKKLGSIYFNQNGGKYTTLCTVDGKKQYNECLLKNNGDFRNTDNSSIVSDYDIIVTNPPFSLFKEYIDFLMKTEKLFLIIGPINALKYKKMFPLIKEKRMWVGNHCGDMEFRVPDYYEPRATRYWQDETGQKWRSLGNICWFTNMKVRKKNKKILLKETFEENKFPKYETYDAINVDKVENIPIGYKGIMGVPITFLTKHNPDQFDIVGELNHGCDNAYDYARPIINGKELYTRILIRAI